MTWHHEFRYRYDITTVLSFWNLIFKIQLCVSTTRRLRFNDAQEWSSFLSFLLSYLCKTLHLWIFISDSSSFIRRHFVIHSFLKWISIIKRAPPLKFNSSFFFLQRWWVFNRLEIKNISKKAQLLFLLKEAQLLKRRTATFFVN